MKRLFIICAALLLSAILEPDPYSTEAYDLIPGLREAVKAAGGADVLVGGPSAVEHDVRKAAARDTLVIPPIEGNEVTRDGRREVGAARSTADAGEPTRGTPSREGAAGRENRWRERCRGHRPSTTSQRNCSE